MSKKMYEVEQLIPFPTIRAFTNLKKARKALKKAGLDPRLPRLDTDAQTSILSSSETKDRMIAIVVMHEDKMKNCTPTEKYMMLVHECVHIMYAWEKEIGEDKLSEEVAAYFVQCSAHSCVTQIGEEWFTATPQA